MSGLQVENLLVKFGGLTAVNSTTFTAPIGQITGLIGPNGAGKTTTFDCCSGLRRPTGGTITFDGVDVTGRSAADRAQRGMGRTFQRMQLYSTLSVADNVALGREARLANWQPWRHLVGRRGDRATLRAAVTDALDRCGIADLRDALPDELSTGQRRLVELARAMAGDYRLLLLDEPSSGLDKAETKRFAAVLRDLVTEVGCGLLLVEHDMSLVLSLCDRIYVLDFGELIFEGTPAEVASSSIVRAAYLGSEEVA